MAKPKSYGETKSHDSHSKMKNSWQNKIATAKQKCHGKVKKSWQTKKATAKLKSSEFYRRIFRNI